MPANTTTLGKYLEALPAWARELSEKYYSRSFALFVLYGNVRDLVPLRTQETTNFVPLDEFLSGALFGQRDVVLHYDRGGLKLGLAESQVELNQGIVQLPGVSSIGIPLPDYAERVEFIRPQLKNQELPTGSEVNDETLAKLGAGLKRVQLQSLISHAVQNRQPLTLKFLSDRKKDLIEAESGGLLEFVQSRFDLSFVAGNDQAKRKLQDAAKAIHAGNTDVLPMGYIICGPVGTGKTFITTCFAGEVGIPAVTLKNFRSMWQGVTEGNLERVLTGVQAMSRFG